jgi:hypothetical protein
MEQLLADSHAGLLNRIADCLNTRPVPNPHGRQAT